MRSVTYPGSVERYVSYNLGTAEWILGQAVVKAAAVRAAAEVLASLSEPE